MILILHIRMVHRFYISENVRFRQIGFYAITGNNGAGKSTFSRCFCGLEKQCGTIIWNGKTYRPKERLKACYMVMQEVNHQLFTETIQDEVMISMKEENEKEADKFLICWI